ncbi:hypothetical protein BKI52_22190 [marine bacterium AO1-C]|nr:hypothetical protein BKI52_22190 [marine bacterium AO1-C]
MKSMSVQKNKFCNKVIYLIKKISITQSSSWFLTCLLTLSVAFTVNGQDNLRKLSIASLQIKGDQLFKTFQYDKAIECFTIVKEKREDEFGKNSQKYLTTLTKLAGYCYQSGRYPKAIPLLQEYLSIVEQKTKPDSLNYIMALNQLANSYQGMKDYRRVEELYQQSLAMTKNIYGDQHLRYAIILDKLAGFYTQIGQYYIAEYTLEQSKRIIVKIQGKKSMYYGQYLYSLADLYLAQAIYHKAKAYFESAKKTIEKHYGKSHPSYVKLLDKLAGILAIDAEQNYKYVEKTTRQQRVESLYEDAKTILASTKGETHPMYATILHNFADFYVTYAVKSPGLFKNEQLAPQYYTKSREIRFKVLGDQHPDYALSLKVIANQQEQANMNSQAQSSYLKAINIKLKEFRRNMLVMSEKGQQTYLRKNSVFFDEFRKYVLNVKANQKLLSRKKRKDISKALFNLELIIKAQLLSNKRRLYQVISQRTTTDSMLLKKYKLYKNLKARVAKRIGQGNTENNDLLGDLREINLLEKYFFSLIGNNSFKAEYSFDAISKCLKKGEGFVDIVRQDSWKRLVGSNGSNNVVCALIFSPVRFFTDVYNFISDLVTGRYKGEYIYMAFVATHNDDYPKVFLLKNVRLEDKHIKHYRESILSQTKDKKGYKKFWKPIAQYFKKRDIQKVYVSPDGVYNRINISTLYNSKTRKYAGEEMDIQIVPTLRNLVDAKLQKDISSFNNEVVLFGRPTYNASLAVLQKGEKGFKIGQNKVNNISSIHSLPVSEELLRKSNKRSGWSDLPGTEAEVKMIAKILTKNKKLNINLSLGNSALELAVKSVERPKILHIATHGFFVEKLRAPTKVKKETIEFDNFSRKGNKKMNLTAMLAKITREEPMLRSGIVLAGAGTYEKSFPKPNIEDGILTAYEASQLDLQGTDLVVLSACETGLGEVENGEGVRGLQRAFMIAGAKSLIFSLWKVDDNATNLLMSKFYEEWISNKKSKREAFGAAQHYLRNYEKNGVKVYEAPYYWGAFIMMGE